MNLSMWREPNVISTPGQSQLFQNNLINQSELKVVNCPIFLRLIVAHRHYEKTIKWFQFRLRGGGIAIFFVALHPELRDANTRRERQQIVQLINEVPLMKTAAKQSGCLPRS